MNTFTGRRPTQQLHRFENGYGASVISDGYGKDAGLFELGVIKFDGDSWDLTYETPITNDVLGYLSHEEVAETLTKIAALTERDIAQHQVARKIGDLEELRAQVTQLEAEIAALEAVS